MLDQSKLSPEQKQILSAQGNILVSASAGSGKTTMMIERVMTLLINGADIRRILIMTFTNDAASEMKSRLIENIYTELRSNSASAAALKKQLEYLPFANIGTMDSFWKTLYQKYFAVIKKDPASSIIEPSEGALMLNYAIEKVIQKHIEDNDEDFFKLAEALSTGRNLDRISANIVALRNFMTAQIDEDAFLNLGGKALDKDSHMAKYVWEYLRKRLKIAREQGQYFVQLLTGIEEHSFADKVAQFVQAATQVINAADYEEFNSCLEFLQAPPKIGKKSVVTAEYGDFVNAVRKVIAEAAEYADAFGGKEQSGRESEKLMELLRQTEQEYSRIKRQKNLLDFNDLSKYALQILADEKTRKEIQQSFDYIFVDEYQDTNYRQEALLEGISRDDNIFVVGDIKQAIYQFRNAEPAIFIDRKNKYDSQKTGSNILLNTNYRSDKRILKFVDKVCGELMTSNFGGVDYKGSSNFVGAAEYKQVDDLPAVSIAVLQKEKAEKSCIDKVYIVSEGEPLSEEIDPDYYYVASKIKEIIGKKIYNSKTKQTTHVNYSDIAILVRKWKQAYGIGSILRTYNIPFNVNNNEKKDCKERELLVDYLAILFNPTKDIKLSNVLLSEIGAFTAAQLLEIKLYSTETTLWESLMAYKGDLAVEEKIKQFELKLDSLRMLSAHSTVSELLQNILQQGYEAVLLNKGSEVVGEINAFIEYIAKSEINNSLEDFLEFYDTSYDGNPSPKLNNAVTITTIFRSKGLEYPIVMLPCLSDNMGKNREDSIIFADSEFGVAVKSIAAERFAITENFAVMAHKLKQSQINREEMVRVLYVALTRAKNHLFLSGLQGKRIAFLEDASSIMDWLNFAAMRNPSLSVYFTGEKPPNIDSAIAVNNVSKSLDLCALNQKYAYLEATKAYAKMSVSQLSNEGEGEFAPSWIASDKVDAEVGTAYHTVLQHLDFTQNTAQAVQSTIEWLVKEGLLGADYAQKVSVNNILGILNWSVIKDNINCKFYREQPFMLYQTVDGGIDKTLIQGVIDLFFVDKNNEGTLIDFKVTNASEDTLRQRYKKQLEIYAAAVENIVGVSVAKKCIYNLLGGYAVYI